MVGCLLVVIVLFSGLGVRLEVSCSSRLSSTGGSSCRGLDLGEIDLGFD